MASSIASYIVLRQDLSSGIGGAKEVPLLLENINIHIPKLTAVDKIGGIFCKICNLLFEAKKDFDAHYGKHNEAEIVYTCPLCKKEHATYAHYRGHCYLQHVMKHKFGCNQCNKTFSKQVDLNTHIKAIHEFKCGECDQKFKTKKELQLHKIVHKKKLTQDPPYKCSTCKELIDSVESCEEHLTNHCEVLYPCPICELVLPNKEEASNHLTEHFDDTPSDSIISNEVLENSAIGLLGGILCCHCDELFSNRSEIESHFDRAHDDKVVVYSCNICEKQYTEYALFGNHCHFHATKGKFKCEECNRLFPRLPLLVMHNLAFHCQNPVDKPYSCDSCIYSFKSHYRLMEHKRLVHDETTLKCQVQGCSATFTSPTEMITHHQGHTSCSDNWCRQCGLKFWSRAACERHLHVHRRQQYACPVCRRAYRERYLLLKHVPKHFESVLHICKICGRSYSARNRLIDHSKTHTNKKKHQCAYCPKSFPGLFALEQHERVHTGNKPYQCTICSKTFAAYPNWTKHLTRVHAFDKNKIKEVREAHKNAASNITNASPIKAESGIESAGSEISDMNGLMDSDSDDGHKSKINLLMNTIDSNIVPKTTEADSAIDQIDIHGDMELLTPVDVGGLNQSFNEFSPCRVDDSSDIKAIVEHIDALSGDLDLPNNPPEMLQYPGMLPVNNVYDMVPEYTSPSLPEPTYYQPAVVPLGLEYGPDFNTLGTTFTELGNLGNDHVLPHIDPMLTIKDEYNATVKNEYNANIKDEFNAKPIQIIPEYNELTLDHNWQPIVTKLYYDEPNDNRMYVLNGMNIF